jgi:unsaturated chondroitin disaccharide hydrolase
MSPSSSILVLLFTLFTLNCLYTHTSAQTIPTQSLFQIIEKQYTRAYTQYLTNPHGEVPLYAKPTSETWNLINPDYPFTGGFFGGMYWLLYWNSVNIGQPNEQWLEYAWTASAGVAPICNNTSTHDVGFPILATFIRGYELTKNESYLSIIHKGALSLASRYSPIVQCTRSWNSDDGFLVIVDNMMNIELLFWAGQFFNNQTWTDMAFHHTNRTMHEHFRVDNSTWHVLIYNETDGSVIKKETNQGYKDWSTWTRGQGWSIHGFAAAYTYTQYQPFLDKAIGAAELFVHRLNKEVTDSVPYWDFDAPWTDGGETPPIRDTSAGAIAASGMLQIAALTEPKGPENFFFQEAVNILSNLSTAAYNIWDHPEYKLPGLLTQAVGSLPANYQVSVAQTYGEFYFTESLIRYSGLVSDWKNAGIVAEDFDLLRELIHSKAPKIVQS